MITYFIKETFAADCETLRLQFGLEKQKIVKKLQPIQTLDHKTQR